MEKKLTRVKMNVYFYKNGKKIERFPPHVWGSLTGVWGDLSDVSGDLSGVRGDLTNVRGDLTGVRGDLSDCAITHEDRAAGIDINDLIDSAEPNAQALREAGDLMQDEVKKSAVAEAAWKESKA